MKEKVLSVISMIISVIIIATMLTITSVLNKNTPILIFTILFAFLGILIGNIGAIIENKRYIKSPAIAGLIGTLIIPVICILTIVGSFLANIII